MCTFSAIKYKAANEEMAVVNEYINDVETGMATFPMYYYGGGDPLTLVLSFRSPAQASTLR